MNRREFIAVGAAATFCPFGHAETPKDSRPIKTLNDYFPLIVPKTLEDWKARRERVREQILVATGLWPMPEKTPLNAVIHSPIQREHYTIEKVYFASRPGHYVTGNLYRPKNSKGPNPGILFAHGHWAKGRFMEADDKEIKAAIASKAERTEASAKYHMQALCATLARRDYVVFQYDMVGYADSTAIGHVAKSGVPHPNGFADVEGELRLQSLMGLQTWNSLRCLDFITSLPNVDAKRIGMTGGSGGGTQTFIAAAIDDRLAATVPAVMVSTGMQGGCVCENCSLLRVGTGNVELAACMAPRPMALTAANDWTKEIMTKGFPELQSIYALYGKKENVTAKAWLEYGHNYNQKAREFMYSFFAKHFEGKDEAVTEPDFVPVPPKELRVFDAEHPRPKDEMNAAELRKAMAVEDATAIKKVVDAKMLSLQKEASEKLGVALDKNKAEQLLGIKLDFGQTEEYHKALRAMICDELPQKIVVRDGPKESKLDGCTVHRAWLGRHDEADVLPTLGAFAPGYKGGKVVLWIHPDGKESLIKDEKFVPAARKLIDDGYAVVSADLFGTGDLKLAKPFAVNPTYAAFTYGYNRSLLAQRVHDILTLVAFGNSMLKPSTMHLVGWGKAGPWTAIARAMADHSIAKTAVELQSFDFAKIEKADDEMMLPGALKYGGLKAILSLAGGEPGTFAVIDAPPRRGKPWTEELTVEWLMTAIPK
jgi:dienelactone hydrolase